MDLDPLESVKEAASTFLKLSGGKLNLLINNAGVSFYSVRQMVDGEVADHARNHGDAAKQDQGGFRAPV